MKLTPTLSELEIFDDATLIIIIINQSESLPTARGLNWKSLWKKAIFQQKYPQ